MTPISIHALLAESDLTVPDLGKRDVWISIHALLAESDLRRYKLGWFQCHFYPRSPCGERPYSQHVRRPSGYFYPRSPCGERPHRSRAASMMALFLSTLSLRRATDCAGCALKKYLISIHALLAESDDSGPRKIKVDFLFLSTLSLRRATLKLCKFKIVIVISIHALLAESDAHLLCQCRPREFLSTLSLRRATAGAVLYNRYTQISIHALLAESD